MSSSIKKICRSCGEVTNAYLIRCKCQDDDYFRNVLAIELALGASRVEIGRAVFEKVQFLEHAGCWIDVLPFESGRTPNAIRIAGTQLM